MLHYGCAMNLARLRKTKKLSQVALGELIGVDGSTIQRAETMHHSAKLETYQKCAEALGVTLADLFTEDLSPVERALVAAFRQIPDQQKHVVQGMVRLAAGQAASSDQ